MNLNKKFLYFSIFLIYLVGSIFFLTAQQEGYEEYDLQTNPVKGVESIELQNVESHTYDIATGELTIQGGETGAVKIDGLEYDLSEGGFLTINATTGDFLEYKFKAKGKEYDFGENVHLTDLPIGTVVTSKDNVFSLENEIFPGGVVQIENAENINYRGLYQRTKPDSTFTFKVGEGGGKMNIGEGEVTLDAGEGSIHNGEISLPGTNSIINKYPLKENSVLIKKGGIWSGEKVDVDYLFKGENYKISKDLVNGVENDLDVKGSLAIKDNKLVVPTSYSATVNNVEIYTRGDVEAEKYASTFLYYDESEIPLDLEKENYVLQQKDNQGNPVMDIHFRKGVVGKSGGSAVALREGNPYMGVKEGQSFEIGGVDNSVSSVVSDVKITKYGDVSIPVIEGEGAYQVHFGNNVFLAGQKHLYVSGPKKGRNSPAFTLTHSMGTDVSGDKRTVFARVMQEGKIVEYKQTHDYLVQATKGGHPLDAYLGKLPESGDVPFNDPKLATKNSVIWDDEELKKGVWEDNVFAEEMPSFQKDAKTVLRSKYIKEFGKVEGLKYYETLVENRQLLTRQNYRDLQSKLEMENHNIPYLTESEVVSIVENNNFLKKRDWNYEKLQDGLRNHAWTLIELHENNMMNDEQFARESLIGIHEIDDMKKQANKEGISFEEYFKKSDLIVGNLVISEKFRKSPYKYEVLAFTSQ